MSRRSTGDVLRQGVMRCLSGTHSFWYRTTGGRVGGRVMGRRVLLLTTKGRRTGRERTKPLTYLRDGERMVVIASNAGFDWHPAWYRNLLAEPRAVVQVGGRRFEVVAETASAEEKERLWPAIVEMSSAYDGYRRRTSRDIPVVFLTPREGRGAS